MPDNNFFRNEIGVIRWKIGPYESFGRGVEIDEDGNYLDTNMLSAKQELDRHPMYGSVDVFSDVEQTYEEKGPYLLSTASDFITRSVKEVVKCLSPGNISVDVTTEYGPIVFSAGTHSVDAFIQNKFGVVYPVPSLNISLLEPYAEELDRLNTASTPVLHSNLVRVTGLDSVKTIEDGDVLLISYSFFHHSDCLRDGKDYSVFRMKGTESSHSLTFDFQPLGGGLMYHLNNIEFVGSRRNFQTIPESFTFQAGIPTVHGGVGIKHIDSGVFPSVKGGEYKVMKYTDVTLKYLKYIFSGSYMGDFVRVVISNSAMQDTATPGDWYEITVVPYYYDNTSNSPDEEVVRGATQVASDSNGKFCAVYLPYTNKFGEAEYQNYVLAYFKVNVNGVETYTGIPNPFTVPGGRVDASSTITTYGFSGSSISTVQVPLTKDFLTENVSQSSNIFYTKFKGVKKDADLVLYVRTPDGTINVHTTVVDIDSDKIQFMDGSTELARLQLSTGRLTFNNYSPGTDLFLKYNFKSDSLQVTPYVLRSAIAEDRYVEFSGIKIYTSSNFSNLFINDESAVTKFEANPSTAGLSNESNTVLVKLLGGGYAKQTIGSKNYDKMSVGGDKISHGMYLQLKELSERTGILGLITDTLDFYRCTIVPGSLSVDRRKTSKSEQEAATSTYQYRMEIQEI